jgi:hypothetical protein
VNKGVFMQRGDAGREIKRKPAPQTGTDWLKQLQKERQESSQLSSGDQPSGSRQTPLAGDQSGDQPSGSRQRPSAVDRYRQKAELQQKWMKGEVSPPQGFKAVTGGLSQGETSQKAKMQPAKKPLPISAEKAKAGIKKPVTGGHLPIQPVRPGQPQNPFENLSYRTGSHEEAFKRWADEKIKLNTPEGWKEERDHIMSNQDYERAYNEWQTWEKQQSGNSGQPN